MSIPQPRIIDTKLPLTWLLGTAGIIVMSLAGFAMNNATNAEKTQAKLDTLIVNMAKLEKRADDRDSRTDALKESQYSMQRAIDGLNMRTDSLERAARK